MHTLFVIYIFIVNGLWQFSVGEIYSGPDYNTEIQRGLSCFQADSLDCAADIFRDLCFRYPDSALPFNARASILIKKANRLYSEKQYKRADRTFISALELSRTAVLIKPDYAQAFYNQGVALLQLRKPYEAEIHFRKALDLSPDMVAAWQHLGLALIRHDSGLSQKTAEAVNAWKTALDLHPDSATACQLYVEMGKALLNIARITEAIDMLDSALAINSHAPEAHFVRGQAYETRGMITEAVAEYRYAIESDPEFLPSYEAIGNAWLVKDALMESIRMYYRVLERDHSDCALTIKLVKCLDIFAIDMRSRMKKAFDLARIIDYRRNRFLGKSVAMYGDERLSTWEGLDSAIANYCISHKKVSYFSNVSDFLAPNAVEKTLQERYDNIITAKAIDPDNSAPYYDFICTAYGWVIAADSIRQEAVRLCESIIPNCPVAELPKPGSP